jgi:hypothetical protein
VGDDDFLAELRALLLGDDAGSHPAVAYFFGGEDLGWRGGPVVGH